MSNVARIFKSSWGRVALVLSVAVAMVVGALPANAVVSIARTNYVVKVLPGTDVAVRATLTSMGDVPTDEIDYVFDGFVVKLSDSEAAALRLDKNVVDVVPDAPISLLDTDTNPPSWGLDRIDQTALPLDNSFTSPNQGGAGVRVYIVDTGVQADNPDFAGRILPGFDVIGTQQQNVDCHGHGTHVAGTAAGTRYGIAKKAMIVPVRVLNCTGSGSFSGIISALDWIKQNNPVGTPAVVNMSIGGGYYQPVNDAVQSLVAAGITASIAAGNSNTDACTASPASAPDAITVGATDSTDARAYYSNYGNCVDIFAPGSSIVSDNAFAPGSSTTMSGTSMATPHITGSAALVLGQHPTWKPADVLKALQDNAVAGKVTNSLTAKDGLLNISFLNAANTTPTPIAGVPAAPTAVKISSITNTGASVAWTAPASDGGSPITSYSVSYRESAVAAWTTVTSNTTSTVLTNLNPLASYQVQVVATNAVGDSVASGIVSFTTLGSLADAPTNFTVTMDHGNYVRLGWTAPANGGNAITSYTIQQFKNNAWVTVAQGSNLTSTLVSSLTPLTAYSFRVWANNASGAGPATQLDYTTGPLAPNAPVVTLTNIYGKGATVNWAPVASTDPNYTVTYELTYGYQYSLTPIKTITNATSGYQITNLYPLMPSWVRVQALEGKSSSGANYLNFTTPADVPSAPSWNSTVKTSTGFNLSWSVGNNGGSAVIDFLVQKSDTNTSTSVWSDVTTTTTAAYTAPIPAAGVTTYYRVSARNAVGSSPFSTATSVWGQVVPASAPQNLAVVAGPNGAGVTLTWDAPANLGGAPVNFYTLRYSTNNGNTWVSANYTAPAGKATGITYNWGIALGKGQVAQFSVVAVTSAGLGAWSSNVSYSVAKTTPGAPLSLRVTTDTTGKLVLTWAAPSDNGGAAISTYLVQTLGSDGSWTTVGQSTNFNYTGNVGVSGAVVTLRVVAVNEVGQGVPSANVVATVPFQKADAPQNVAGVINASANRVELTWAAPANLYGGTLTSYIVQISTNNGVSWVAYSQVPATATGAYLPIMSKGATSLYRVYAITQAGVGNYSATVTLTRDVTAPSAPTTRGITLTSGNIPNISWNAPSDNGGSAITGYVVEQNSANGWAVIGRVAGNVTTFADTAEAPGTALQYRISAVNAIGTSPASAVVAFTMPLVKPGAPTGLTLNDTANAGRLTLSWTAPTDFGGAAGATYYFVDVSTNGGTSWSSYAVAGNLTAYVVNKPAKGQTFTIRVMTSTGFGRSDASNVVTYSVAATAPSAPYGTRATFGSDGNPIFVWYAPSDNGGSPITAYLVELGTAPNNASGTIAWTAPVTVAGNVLSYTGVRASAGVYQFARVTAVNALGNSPVSNVGSIMVPLLKPAAPTNFAGSQPVAGSTNVALTWVASTNLGGALSAQYQIEKSIDNGATWQVYGSTSAVGATVSGPAKGVAWQYRLATKTGFGLSDYTPAVTIATPTTVPSYPNGISGSLSTDGTNLVALRWNAPADTGGVIITGYRIDRSENNSATWNTIATTNGSTLTAAIPFSAPGVAVTYRVYAINPVGVSTGAIVYQVRMPYAVPGATSAPVITTASNSTTSAPRILVSWSAVTNFGGSTLSFYQLQQSTDGITWSAVASTTGLSWTLAKPAAGTRLFFRVVTMTSVGLSNASAVTTATF